MRPVTYYTFPKAPKHYFTEADIGREFVRTNSSFNDDLRWVVKRGSLLSSDEEQVRKYAVKLLVLCLKNLYNNFGVKAAEIAERKFIRIA